jgi:NAD(P)-dependent dehydrogenase (short-subunit alcohol dehydrogenase family)
MEIAMSKVVLVTGASSGLGRATAALLAAGGIRVYGTSRTPARDDLGWPMLPLDVRSNSSVAACVAQVLMREGRIDALVNNAGYAFVGAVEETSLDETRAQLETNFFGALRMMQAVLPAMQAQGSGRIVNISSLAGAVAFPFLGAYAASKQALEAMSEALAHELRGSDVRVTLLEPDGMRTAIGFHHPRVEHPTLGPRRRHVLGLLQHATTGAGNDPELLARAVADAIASPAPPLRIVIGEGARRMIAARRTMSEAEFGALIAAQIAPVA